MKLLIKHTLNHCQFDFWTSRLYCTVNVDDRKQTVSMQTFGVFISSILWICGLSKVCHVRQSGKTYIRENRCINWCIIVVAFDVTTCTFGPRQANLVLIAYASSEGSCEPAHPHSLTRTSAARSYKQWDKRNLQIESQIPGPSECLGMRS